MRQAMAMPVRRRYFRVSTRQKAQLYLQHTSPHTPLGRQKRIDFLDRLDRNFR